MKNSTLAMILGTVGGIIFLIIPTIDILTHPGKHDGNAIFFGYCAGFFAATIISMIVFAISYFILKQFRKGK